MFQFQFGFQFNSVLDAVSIPTAYLSLSRSFTLGWFNGQLVVSLVQFDRVPVGAITVAGSWFPLCFDHGRSVTVGSLSFDHGWIFGSFFFCCRSIALQLRRSLLACLDRVNVVGSWCRPSESCRSILLDGSCLVVSLKFNHAHFFESIHCSTLVPFFLCRRRLSSRVDLLLLMVFG